MTNRDLRALRQQLESLSLAGLTHLPAETQSEAELQANVPGPQATLTAPVVAVRAPAKARNQQSAMPENRMKEAGKALFQETEGRRERGTHPGADAPGSPGSLKARKTALAVLNEKVKKCTRCSELAGTRTQTVFGVGNPAARILFIGEAPGADEDVQGEPFVGKAGQLLNQIIVASRLTREEIYICNVLKCRPPGNRTPAEDECANCREFLLGQLETIDPEYIVCWGAVAAQNLLTTKLSIGKLRGRFLQYGRAKVLCTYHPSYLLRNPAAKKDVWQDMQFLMADLGVDLKSKS